MKPKIIYSLSLLLLVSVFHLRAQMRVHLINVGQGCATLIEFPCAAILVDAGGEKNPAYNATEELQIYLDQFFNRRTDLNYTLECVYLTHPHTDHTMGVPLLLDMPYTIKNAVTDGLDQNSGQLKLHRAAAASQNNEDPSDDINLELVTTDKIGSQGFTNAIIDPVHCAGTDPEIKIFWGGSLSDPGWGSTAFKNINNHSLVIRIGYGSSSLLITGDLEEKGLESLVGKYAGSNLLDADVYVVGHHASENATSQDLLDAVTPTMALIGVGDPIRQYPRTAWGHGHPNAGVLDMLERQITATRNPIVIQAGSRSQTFDSYTVSKAIYATGWDGHIVLEADNSGHWHKVGEEVVPELININTAPALLLETLPGIGSTKAQAIVDYRNINGNFESIDDLDEVFGIGPSIIEQIRNLVKI